MGAMEVLVAAMNQADAALYHHMGLTTDAVIANQTDSAWCRNYEIDGNRVKVVSTKDRGVGKNRNLALLNASAELCLIADQDLVYTPDYQEIINRAFAELPAADMIVFNIRNSGEPEQRSITGVKKVRIFNFARHGAPNLVFKRESLLRANLWFSLLFGGGARYSCGEDSLFLREALRKKLKIYTYPETIASTGRDTSTWFTGYTDKFFFDKGALVACLFPRLKVLAGFYIALRFKGRSQFTYRQVLNYVFSGVRAFGKEAAYDEWQEKSADCQ